MTSPTALARVRSLLGFLLPLAGMATAYSQSIVQEYYVPMPEAQIRQTFVALASNTGTTMDTTVSMVAAVNGTKIVYDHWEDGYEVSLDNPTQSSTQVWGDGNDANGKPPGFATDPNGLSAGTVIALRNSIALPRNPTSFLYDGRDRVGATRGITMTRSSWPTTPGSVLADATEIYSTVDWGTNFVIPVGEDEIFPTPLTASMFELCSLFVQASQPNTSVQIDKDGNGTVDTTVILNQGETYYLERGLLKGATVVATKPVQVDIITGDIGGNYECRWYTVAPLAQWGSRYYSPVGTATNGDDTYVFLYNPDSAAISVNVTTRVGSSVISIPAKSNYRYLMPQDSGASFINTAGKPFYGIACVGALPTANNVHDWGFSLVQEADLTTTLSLGWGPGSSEVTPTVNGNPVWVTPVKNTTIYVDYNGDRLGSVTDPLGGKCDASYSAAALQVLRLFDPDKDQTGMRVYTVDGTLIAGAWGQDPATAGPGNPYLDAGTTIPAFPVPIIRKSSAIAIDANTSGLSIGDTLEYSITMDNAGLVALGNILVIDALPAQVTYVANSSSRDGVAIADNTTGTPFPLDAAGINIPILARGQTTTFKYRAVINAAGSINNTVTTSYSGVTSTNTVSVPGGGTAAITNFSLSGGTTATSYLPGDGIYVTVSDPDANTSNQPQSITVIVKNATTGDYETITLAETTGTSGIFRNTTPLPSSSAAGTNPNDGTLNVFSGNGLTVSYTDPVYGETASAAATIGAPTPSKVLYLSADGVGSPDQDLDRIDPVASSDTTLSSTGIITATGTVTAGTPTLGSFTGPTSGSTASVTMAHPVSGNNRLLLLSVNYEDDGTAGMAINTITYGAQSLTRIAKVATTEEAVAELWYLVNPATGTNTNITVNMGAFSSGDALQLAATTFTNVDQTTPLGTFASATGYTAAASLSMTAATGELIVANLAVDDSRPATISASGQTALWNTNAGGVATGGDGIRSAGSTRAGTGAAGVSSWTLGTSDAWAVIGVPVKPAAATSTLTFTQTPGFGESFTLPSGAVLGAQTYFTATTGTLSGTVAVTAALRYGSTTVATSSSASASGSLITFTFPALSSAVTIPSGQPLSLDITTAVSGVAFQIDYDQNTKPSKITLPTSTVIHTDSVGVYDAPYPGGTLVTSPANGQTLYVRTVVGDPFGAYDITSVGLTIDGPGTTDDITTTLTNTNVVASTTAGKTYEYVWRTGGTVGQYSVVANAKEGLENTISSSRSASINLNYLDLGTPSSVDFLTTGGAVTNTYAANESVVIRVTDLDENKNSAAVETVIVRLTSSTGDVETITLTETGVNTGVFTATVPASATTAGTSGNGTIYAPTGSALSVSYVDSNDSSDTSSKNATVPAPTAVDGVSLTKTLVSPSSGQAIVGGAIQYRLRVVNTGGTSLSTVALTDTFPVANLTYVSASTTPSSVSGGTITWSNVGPLAQGASAEVFVNFTANAAGGTVTNSASATAGTATSNSSAPVTITRPRVAVTKTVTSPTSGTAGKGDNVVFSIAVQNTGTTAIPSLPLEDIFSGQTFDYVTSSLAPDAVGTGSLLWNDITGAGSLAVGATQTISVTLKVKGEANPATNTAAVNYATDSNGDAVPATSSAATIVTSAASIKGFVLEDKGAAGFGGGDTALSNITLTLYSDPNNDGDPSDGTVLAITTSAADGSYEFLNLALGGYVVVESDPTGYSSVADVDGANDNRIKVTATTFTATTGRNFLDKYIDPALYSNISGQVRNDTDGDGDLTDADSGITGVTIDLYTDPNGDGNASDGTLYLSTTTNASGNYSFTLIPPGSYVVIETDLSGYASTADKTLPNDNQVPVTVAANGTSTGNDFLDSNNLTLLGTMGDVVWADTNNNGLFDSGETGIPNVIVQLYRSTQTVGVGAPYRTTTTGLGGIYSFANVPAGSYRIYLPVANFSGNGALVNYPLSSYFTVTTDNQQNNDDNGIQTSSGLPVQSPLIAISANETDNTVDFGFVPNTSLGSISGTVLDDLNNDNTGDTGIAGVTITLWTDPNADGNQADGVVFATTTTAANGSYSFTNLPPGAYVVVESQPVGYLNVSDTDGGTDLSKVAVVLPAAGSKTASFVEERPGIVTGHVYIDTNGNGTQQVGEPNVSGASIVITDSNNATQTVTTDASGNWTATVPPGTTSANVLEGQSPFPAGIVQTEGDDPTTVTANAGATVSAGNDGYFRPAIVTGHIYRDVLGNNTEDGSDSGLANIIVRITDSLGVVRNVLTDSSGNWTVSVPPGDTIADVLELDSSFPSGAVRREGTDPTTVTAVAGTSTSAGKDGFYFPATVTGHLYLDVNGNGVQDSGESSLANVDVLITASNGTTQTVASDNAGNWTATVPPGTTSANVQESDPQFPVGAVQTQGDDPTTFTAVAAQVTSGGIDGYFVPAIATGHIYLDRNGNGVEDSGELPLANIPLVITDSLGNTRTVTTNASGNWTASVPPGATIADIVDSSPNIPAGAVRTQGTDPTTFTAVAGTTADGGKDGFYVPATVSGHLYVDSNGNGSQGAGEPGLPNVTVTITDSTGTVRTVVTDANGNWSLSVPPGSTIVDVDNSDPDFPAGGTLSQGTDPVTITAVANSNTSTGPIGYKILGFVSGHLYIDVNNNHVQDSGEPNLIGVNVLVTPSQGSVITVESDASGNWVASVPPGSTSAKVDTTDPQFPSGATQSDGTDPTAVTAVAGTTVSAGNDGYYISTIVTGTVYLDVNHNGSRDSGEPGLAGVSVNVTDSNAVVRSVVTGQNGVWTASVPPGGTISVVQESGPVFTSGYQRTQGTGTSTVTAVVNNQTSVAITGYYFPGTVSGHLFSDTNGNGIEDSGEPGLGGVHVVITDSLGNTQTVITNGAGNWTASVPPGSTTVDITNADLPSGSTQTTGTDPVIIAAVAGQTTPAGSAAGFYQAATVTGHLYLDVNGNGAQDGSEPALVGVNVFVAASNGNTQTVVTDANGNWSASVPPGTTKIDIDESDAQYPSGATQTQGVALTTVTAVAGATTGTTPSGFFVPATITGHLYLDLNGNGTQDFVTHDLAGVDIIILDSNSHTQRVTTGANGNWSATVPPGAVIATVDSADPEYPTGSVITQGSAATSFTAVAGSTTGSTPVGFFFPATVNGHLYLDSNGNGHQDSGEPNLPDIDVRITSAINNVQTVVTDANGNWVATVPPGSTIVDIQENDPQYPANVTQTEGSDPSTVSAVASLNTFAGNDGFYRAATISGHLFSDTNGNGVEDSGEPGLEGVDILITDANGNQQTVTTDSNGNWTASVPPGSTIVDIVDSDPQIPAGATRTTAGADPVTFTAVAGQNTPAPTTIGFFQSAAVTGLLYADANGNGSQQNGEQGIPNVNIRVTDSLNNVHIVVTGADGTWTASVPPGAVRVVVDATDPDFPAGVTLTDGTEPTDVTAIAGQTVDAGKDGYYLPATVSGFVYRDVNGNGSYEGSGSDTPLAGVKVRVTDSLGTVRDVLTNSSGVWTVSVPPGDTTANVLELDATFPSGGTRSEGSNPATVSAVAGSTVSGGTDGYYFPATVTGLVFLDTNGNGTQDGGEHGIADLDIEITDSNNTVQVVVTDASGAWTASVPPGSTLIRVVSSDPEYPAGSTQTAGTNPNSVTAVANQSVSAGVDGYYIVATVTGVIYRDTNGNGTQQGGEAGIAGVTVRITDSLGNNQIVTTNGSGVWTANVPPGQTTVKILDANSQIPAGSVLREGSDPGTVTAIAGVTANAGKDGFFLPALLTGHLFNDVDGNGVEGPGDTPMANIDVIITDSNGNVQTVVTDASGNWSVSVPPGSTIVNVNQNDANFPAGGTLTVGTDPFTVTAVAGSTVNTTPMAYRILGIVTGHLYIDTNNSGAQDPGEPNLANITVKVTDSLGQDHFVVTNTGGNWTASVPTGSTTIDVDNSDPDFPAVTSQSEGTDPNTVSALAGTTVNGGNDGYYIATSVTGTLYTDRNNNGSRDPGEPGLAGVSVQVTSINGTQTVVTDSNGNWTASVPPGSVTATVQQTGPIFTTGYVRTEGTGTGTVTAATGSPAVVPVNGYYFPGTVTGHLYLDVNGNGQQDSGEPNLPNISLVITPNNGVVTTVSTDANGNWSLLTAPGPLSADIDESDLDLPAGAVHLEGTDPTVVTVISGQSVDGGTDGFYIPAFVSGHLYRDVNGNGVQDSGEPNLANVNVSVAASNGNTLTAVTDADGNWTASVSPGTTIIDIDESDPDFPEGAQQSQGTAVTTVTAIANGTVSGGVNGYFVPAIITGHLYLDLNGNGQQDFVFHDLANVDVIIVDSNGNTKRVTTNATGNWTASVPPGPATATIDAGDPEYPAGYVITQGALTTPFNAVAGTTQPSTPVGFFLPADITGHLYLDTNGNGTQDQGEPNLPGVDVVITTAINNTLTVTTDENGNWHASVPPGNTTVDVQESDPQYPSGSTQSEGSDPTVVTTVGGVMTFAGNDGFYRSGTISGHLFTDTNGNGVEDSGEPGLGGIHLVITDVNGNTQTVVTGPDGNWTATVPPGNTTVDIVDGDLPTGVIRTTPGIDPTSMTAVAGTNTPVPGGAGFFAPGTIRGFVLVDDNGDGIADRGLGGVLIGLFDPSSNLLANTTTAADGSYTFTGRPPGSYVITELQPDGYLSVSDSDGGDPDSIGDVTPVMLAAGAIISNQNFLERPLKEPNHFGGWQTANQLGGLNGPTDNPDGDLSNNLIEYAFALDPASGAGNPFCIVPSLTQAGKLDAVYTRTAGGALDVRYELQSISSLLLSPGGWNAVTLTPANYTVTDNGDGSETVRILDLQGLTGMPDIGFVRMRVRLDANGDSIYEATATTETGGWQHSAWGTECRTYSNPFVSCPPFSGIVDSVNGQQIILGASASGLNLAAVMPPGSLYYLEVTSGDLAGHRFDVTATGTGTLSLANDSSLVADTAPYNTLTGALPASLAGDSFVIRVHWTLGQMFPVEAFSGTTSQETADQVQTFSNGAYTSYWLYDDGVSTPRWVRMDDTLLADQGGKVVPPGQGIFIRCLEQPGSLLAYGKVRQNDFVLPLMAGNNLVSSAYPLAESPLSRGMTIPNGFDGDRDFKKADEIFIWRGDLTQGASGYDTYFLLDGAPVQPALRRWAKVGDATLAPRDSSLLFTGNHSAFIKLNAALPSHRITRPWQP